MNEVRGGGGGCILRPACGCYTPQALVKILIFIIFNDKRFKKVQKSKKLATKFNKKMLVFLKFVPKCWLGVLFPDYIVSLQGVLFKESYLLQSNSTKQAQPKFKHATEWLKLIS